MRRVLYGLMLFLLLCVPRSYAAGVVLVRATVSAPNEAERKYGETVNRHLDRWLTEMNVPHEVVDDNQVGPALARARVAILGYNPNPPRSELADLKAFVNRGGKLIVFYSADPDLAALLHMKMGKYQTGGAWGAIRFNQQAPPHLPTIVYQDSRNIRLVHPSDTSAKVIASWETAGGKALPDPAWVQSDRGAWMTHVMLDDGDSWSKKRMLLGLVGVYDPSVWAPAAARCLQEASTLGKFKTFAEATQAIPALATGTAEQRRAKAAMAAVVALYNELAAALNDRRYAEVVERSQGLRALLLEAYGAAQAPRSGELRAVWDRFGMGLYPGDWNRTCRQLALQGVTDIIPFVVSPVEANYDSRLVPASATMSTYGNQLKQCVEAAHRNGLKVHAWKICWKVDNADADVLKKLRKQGRLQVTDKGETLNWLCPSNLENIQVEKDAIREIVKNYGVDGIHLDYIRYSDGHVCFCETCRAAYARDTGRALTPWPPPADKWPLRKEYYRWRQAQITRFVRDVSALARTVRPGIKISAAVYGKYPGCVEGVGQDWAAWLQSGIMDFVCPMDYTTNVTQFAEYVRNQVSLPGTAGKVYPGIGVTATESRLDPIQVVDQIVALRKEGAPGFALFELNHVLEKEVLPILSLGLTGR